MNFECRHPLCYYCLICSGVLKCPICRKELKKGLSQETIDLVEFVGKQHKKITDLENDIAAFRLSDTNPNWNLFENIFNINPNWNLFDNVDMSFTFRTNQQNQS